MPEMSFLPEDYLEKKIQRRTNLMCLALFAVVMAGIVAAYMVTDRQGAEVRGMKKNIDAQYEAAAKRLDELDQLQQKKQQMIHKAQVTAVLVERVPRSAVLAEVVNAMPPSVSLTSFGLDTRAVRGRRAPSGTALDEAKRAKAAAARADVDVAATEVSVQIQGLATTDVEVAQFMGVLGKCPLFMELNLAFSEQGAEDVHSQRRFHIDLKINQEVDMRKFVPTLARRDALKNPLDAPNPNSSAVVPVIERTDLPVISPFKD